jgi:hypothetical protein
MPTNTKSNEAVLAVKLAAGTQKYLSTATQLFVGDGTFTPAEVEAKLQSLATLRNDVDTAKSAVKAKLEDERNQGPALRGFLLSFVSFVRAAFGGSPDVLAEFGLAPKKVRKPLTAEQRAAAKAKRESTRKARGTMGKKEKLAIKGNVTGVEVIPVTASQPLPSLAVSGAPATVPNGAVR